MKGFKSFCLVALLVVSAFLVTACSKKNELVGSWTYESGSYVYTFNEDGTGEYAGMKFTYTTEGEKISILYDGNTAPFESVYSIEGNKLNIKDSYGNDTFYIKNN